MLDIYKMKHLLFQTVFKLNRHSLVKIKHNLSHDMSQPIHLGTPNEAKRSKQKSSSELL